MYDAKSINLIIGGVLISGLAGGSFIKIKRNKPLFTQKVGSHGDVCEIRSTDKTGILTFSLLSKSRGNDAMSALILADESSPYGTTALPILIKDSNGTTLATGMGRISQWPDLEWSEDSPVHEWTILLNTLELFVGGHD